MSVPDHTLTDLLGIVRAFVKSLDVNDALRDDIISDTALVISKCLDTIEDLNPEDATRWVRGVAFFSARNSQRTEFRRTAAWRRLRRSTPNLDPVFSGSAEDTASTLLGSGLAVLSALDQALLVDQVWEGCTSTELAARHGLSEIALRKRLSRARKAAREEILRSL
jgi:DNA-directed RNA polymerase specialized sigma24 family protein